MRRAGCGPRDPGAEGEALPRPGDGRAQGRRVHMLRQTRLRAPSMPSPGRGAAPRGLLSLCEAGRVQPQGRPVRPFQETKGERVTNQDGQARRVPSAELGRGRRRRARLQGRRCLEDRGPGRPLRPVGVGAKPRRRGKPAQRPRRRTRSRVRRSGEDHPLRAEPAGRGGGEVQDGLRRSRVPQAHARPLLRRPEALVHLLGRGHGLHGAGGGRPGRGGEGGEADRGLRGLDRKPGATRRPPAPGRGLERHSAARWE
mmetsp:Transcript_4800/g.11285  ORF Transcript_4800/g.11285 Transcript_4800/m.11285 type:complete len:256 (-) Transcript_4800:177-944(-)